jgi:hypothetical protein
MSKVTFDGPNKLIIINTGVTNIDVMTEMYLPWKQWVIDEGSMYLAAFRAFGGDPTTTDQNAPYYYFLINNWRVVATNVNVVISENLYSDNYENPYVITNSSVLSKNSDIPGITDVASSLTGITQTLTGITNTLSLMSIDIKLILGLVQHNYRLSDHAYDSGQRLTAVKIKLYNTKTDCDNAVNEFATYQMNSSYDVNGLLIDYKVVKI